MGSDKLWSALDRFRTSRWGVALYYAYLVGILVAAIVAVTAITRNHALAVKANDAANLANRSLCFEKRAAMGQLEGTRKFLREHPDGTADFSRALILNAIRTDEVDVAALRDIHCDKYGARN